MTCADVNINFNFNEKLFVNLNNYIGEDLRISLRSQKVEII